MPTVQERVGVLEERVANIDEKIDDIKNDVKENHQDIKVQLKTMYDASCSQHAELNKKIQEIEGFRLKWSYMIAGGVAVLGIVIGHFDKLEHFLK